MSELVLIRTERPSNRENLVPDNGPSTAPKTHAIFSENARLPQALAKTCTLDFVRYWAGIKATVNSSRR